MKQWTRTRARRAVWIALLGVITIFTSPRSADAYLISTAPLPEVLKGASDVVRVAWPPEEGVLRIQEVYRGDLEPGASLPDGMLRLRLPLTTRFGTITHREDGPRKECKLVGFILALYEMDGRYHLVGERAPHGVTPHSSIRLIGEGNRVFRLRQIINPGGVSPVRAEAATLEAFEALLRKQIRAHPLQMPAYRSVPEAERARWWALTEPALDWYERCVRDYRWSSENRVALAKRIVAYAKTAPKGMATHVFDALQLLADANGHASSHEEELTRMITAHAKRAGIEAIAELLLHELDKGDYWTRNRTVLLAVAKRVDPELYKRARSVLVALGKRQAHNEGLAAYWALVRNGEAELAAEVKKAQGWE